MSRFSGVLFGVSLAMVVAMTPASTAEDKPIFALALHGGAGGDPGQWDEPTKQARRLGLSQALERGIELLAAGGTALDAVESVVSVLEDDPNFNAGRGCVLNSQGEHELDASIMDGSNLQCGAVASARRAKNPIGLARRVMSDTRHVLLIGGGADQFAEQLGVELKDDDYFRTPRQVANWERWKSRQPDVTLHRPKSQAADEDQLYLGTVGCVALDQHGNLAAATSTGGLMGKRPGRVGDSPLIGAGNYANNDSCAVSGTGVGEEFIRHQVAADVAARMRYAQQPLREAAQAVIAKLPEDCGGIIAIDRTGQIVMEFNTPGMSRAACDASGRRLIALGREE